MKKEDFAPKFTKKELCAYVVAAVVMIILAVMATFDVLPEYPSVKSKDGCISEMERYLQEPLGKVSEGFEIISNSDTIRVKNMNTEVEYICTTLENGEQRYSSYIPSGVAYIFEVVIFIVFFTGMFTLTTLFILCFGGAVIAYYKEDKQVKEDVVQQTEKSN